MSFCVSVRVFVNSTLPCEATPTADARRRPATFVITSDAKIALIHYTCNTYRNTDSTFEVLSRMAQLLMQQLGRGIRN